MKLRDIPHTEVPKSLSWLYWVVVFGAVVWFYAVSFIGVQGIMRASDLVELNGGLHIENFLLKRQIGKMKWLLAGMSSDSVWATATTAIDAYDTVWMSIRVRPDTAQGER